LLEDGFQVFKKTPGAGLVDRLRIIFIRSDGEEEAGIDGGGLFKEFLHLWVREVTKPDFDFFVQLPGGQLCPKPLVINEEVYAALGKAVGKALFECILNETRFSEVFIGRALGRPWSVDELEELDPVLHRNLLTLKDRKNCSELGLTFSTVVEEGGFMREYDLIPDGRNVTVDDSNKTLYIHKLARFKLLTQISSQSRAFSQGLAEVISLDALKLFSPSELQLLMAGEERKGFDVEDLKRNASYYGYGRLSETIEAFWAVLGNDLSPGDQSALLSFVTGSPRAPLLGFKVLNPKFTIQKIPDATRLPTASTCVNLLKLPDYQDRQSLREKLLLAIHSGAGFDLS
jgi:ubiquitin-protein ligase E3 C